MSANWNQYRKNNECQQTKNEKKKCKVFLDWLDYYLLPIYPDYSTITSPLSDLTKKGHSNKIIRKKEQEDAYNLLKEKVSSYPILKLPDFSRPFILRIDASNTGIGSVLMQKYDDSLFSIYYASKKLTEQEKKFSTIEKECLAIIWAVKKFNNYLYGTEFTLETDHNTLQYLERAKFVNARVMRWSLCLQQYRMNIQYIKGSLNCTADYLSRIDN